MPKSGELRVDFRIVFLRGPCFWTENGDGGVNVGKSGNIVKEKVVENGAKTGTFFWFLGESKGILAESEGKNGEK